MSAAGWIGLLAWLLTAAAAGCLEAVIYDSRPFMAAVIVVALGLWMGFLGTFFVRWARCRNRLIALITGMLAGILLLLSGWTIDHYRHSTEWKPKELPSYLIQRVATGLHFGLDDASEDLPALEGTKRILSWAGFWAEVAGTLFLTSLLPWRIVRTDPYCESCGSYMTRDVFALAAGSSQDVLQAIRAGSLKPFLDQWALPYNPGTVATLVAVHDCPEQGACRGEEGYASVLEADGTPNLAGPFHPSSAFFGNMPLELGRLEADDLQALRPRLGSTRDGEAFLAASSLSELLEEEQPTSKPHFADGEAVIEDIKDRTAGAVLAKQSLALSVIFQFIPVLALLGGLFLLAYVVDEPRLGSLGPAIATLIGAAMLVVLLSFLRDVNFFEGLLPYMRMKSSLGSRADLIVDPQKHEAFFVDIVPRANWGRTMAENASDLGFLRVDLEAKRLLFEGDRQRYTVPAKKLLAMELTHLGQSVKTAGIETTQRPVMILHVEAPEKAIEIPVVLRHSALWKTMRYGGRGNFNRMADAVDALLPEEIGPPQAAPPPLARSGLDEKMPR